MSNDNIAERLEGVDIEPLTAVLRERIEILLDNDPTYFIDSEDKDRIVANLEAIIDLVKCQHVHIWKYYDGALGYESLVCSHCGIDINELTRTVAA